MNFTEAIKTCFDKYAVFNGRASRSEYWYFALFIFLISASLSVLGRVFSGSTMVILFAGINLLFSLGTLLPSLAVSTRRLHDSNRSGLWLLLMLIPVLSIFLIGILMLFMPGPVVMLLFLIPLGAVVAMIVLLALAGKEPNRFGPAPDRT